ncbi:MAG: DUF72 domain-containing protein [Nitrospirae bacterium]|nr:DUF72 domain-containing protein [Nitrospirota bacterium]
MATVLVGTSGWSYPGWRDSFYPEGLPASRRLEFYARRFPTTEVNYSFYHLPRPSTYEKWAGQVPEQFVFALKASRLITHTKRLSDVEEPWRAFVQNAGALGTHFGPILLQFPASFPQDTQRLADFLSMARRGSPRGLRLVCEFRHESWFTDRVYRALERHHAALCIADSPSYPRQDVLTADFTYVRFHGREQLFASSYTDSQLSREARAIRRYEREGEDVYVYFNNDAHGAAVKNAHTLRALLEG